jgi:16S rRNA (uracil1498-N3)-methyltransferase
MIPKPPESASRGPAPGEAHPVRAHAPRLGGATAGQSLGLSEEVAHHLVRVRRLGEGESLEVFDDSGLVAPGTLLRQGGEWTVRLLADPRPGPPSRGITIFSAIPKGSRADWMVEKLSELGAAALVPIVTSRSVVEPGAGKLERFARLARESARQSRRGGVMRVEPLATLEQAIEQFRQAGQAGALLATERPGASLADLDVSCLFVGPEGGWTQQELDLLTAAGLIPARLTGSILRVETAAVAGAAVLLVRLATGYDPGA